MTTQPTYCDYILYIYICYIEIFDLIRPRSEVCEHFGASHLGVWICFRFEFVSGTPGLVRHSRCFVRRYRPLSISPMAHNFCVSGVSGVSVLASRTSWFPKIVQFPAGLIIDLWTEVAATFRQWLKNEKTIQDMSDMSIIDALGFLMERMGHRIELNWKWLRVLDALHTGRTRRLRLQWRPMPSQSYHDTP